MDREVVLALGYATFLVGVACALTGWARHIDKWTAGGAPAWHKSEEARLRRALALALLFLSAVLLLAEMVRHPHMTCFGALSAGLLISGCLGWRGYATFPRKQSTIVPEAKYPSGERRG